MIYYTRLFLENRMEGAHSSASAHFALSMSFGLVAPAAYLALRRLLSVLLVLSLLFLLVLVLVLVLLFFFFLLLLL